MLGGILFPYAVTLIFFVTLHSEKSTNMKQSLILLFWVVSSVIMAKDIMAEAIIKSEMKRCPQACYTDSPTRVKWSYTGGLKVGAMLDYYEVSKDRTVLDYCMQYADSFITNDGQIRSYKLTEYNIDMINSGKCLFQFYRLTGEERFHKALTLLRSQLDTHPRNADGGFWHKKIYPNQVWLDGVYMGTPFLAEYTYCFDKDNKSAWADVVNQILMAARHTYDSQKGLFRHACDVSRKMGWADPQTGQSSHCWGRALGWYMMAIVDALPFIPEEVEGRDSILIVLNTIAEGIDRYKDEKTGLWYQVLDSPERTGNYLESSCSAMFIYSMLKAVRLGYLPKKYKAIAKRSYKNFIKQFIYTSTEQLPDGSISTLVNIGSCCAVAGLSKDRPGTFDYYINERKQDNDPKVVGPFIKASIEMNR